ncbi:ATP-binding protein [Teichococcus aestuarii]|uniref:ATP-binding protein n=1 Tax=Teichococcus aestuarii TaxID=568898 RepID=UPI00360725A3
MAMPLRDLWPRWRASLRRSPAAFQSLLAGLPEPALWLDGAARLRGGNAALRAALGPSLPLRTGTPITLIFAPESRAALQQWLAGGPEPPELRLAAPLGQPGLIVLPRRIALPQGEAVLLLTDAAPRKALAAQLAESDRLQALGGLAGGIAHDFNNLLSVVLGAAEEARRHLGENPDPALAAELEQVRQAAQRGAGLVRQLLAYARQQVLEPRLVPLNTAVSEMARMLRPLLGRAIALELELDSPGRLVRIDPSQLDRVLMNLAMNARQAMPEGGRLTLATSRALLLQPEPAMPEPIPAGRWTVLEVRDTGHGIPPEILPRIFEPFFTSRPQQGGTGMGLATVHGIVRQSGGYIAVESRPGQGTRIRILLPRTEAPAAGPPSPPAASLPTDRAQAEPAPAEAPMAAPAGGGPLLLVEDEAPLRRLAERTLRRAGWPVLAAEDAEAALALAAESPPALLVSDVMMLGAMDGPALARALRARNPRLPVLLVSGYAPSVVEEGLSDQGLRFLAKPYTAAELTAAVADLADVAGASCGTPQS